MPDFRIPLPWPETTDKAQLRLLVVDDDDVDRERVRRMLLRTAPDATVVEACDPEETLALLQEPELYEEATALLNAALDDSFDRDPIWGATLRGHALAASRVGKLAAAPAKPRAGTKAKPAARPKPAARKVAVRRPAKGRTRRR